MNLKESLQLALEERLELAEEYDLEPEELDSLPAPASDESIAVVEGKLGFKLGEVGDLLRLMDGIPQWQGVYTFFGTESYMCSEYDEAYEGFEVYRDGARGHQADGEDFWGYAEPSDCLLFARDPESYDLFFCYVTDGVATGPFLWVAGDEIRRTDTLADFLAYEDED